MNTAPRTETPALIAAMDHWAKTVAKNGGIAAVTIQEGADRLLELEAELKAALSECEEQARLLGMSASREASLLSKISRLERQIDTAIFRSNQAYYKNQIKK